MAAAAARLSPHAVPNLLTPPADGQPRAYGSVELRPYQQVAIASVVRAWQQGQLQQLVSMPTGTGKTVCFLGLVRYVCEQCLAAAAQQPAASSPGGSSSEAESEGEDGGGWTAAADGTSSSSSGPAPASSDTPLLRVMILAHRSELLTQAEDAMKLVWPEAAVSVLSQERKDLSGQVGCLVVEGVRGWWWGWGW